MSTSQVRLRGQRSIRACKAHKQLGKLVEAFPGGIGPVVRRTIIPPPEVPCSKWSLCNRVLVSLSGTDDARGYRQWQRVGRHIKKGSKALYIFVPRMIRQQPSERDEDDDSVLVLKGFSARPVFRVEDTEGAPIQRPHIEPLTLPPLIEVAERLGVEVRYQGHQGDAYGYFSPEGRKIVLESHDAPTFWHELAHAAHLRVRGPLKSGQDPEQEAVAELTATVIAGLYGSDWSGNCWQYIGRYTQNPLGLCLAVLSEVEKVLNVILSANGKRI